jgi:signal transduction histidine kinase/HAMP domain-containing protein
MSVEESRRSEGRSSLGVTLGMRAALAAPGLSLSVGTKLVTAVLTVLILLTVGGYVGLSHMERETMLTAKEKAVRMASDLFLRAAATPVIFDDATGIRETVALLSQEPEVIGVELWRWAPIETGGAILASQLKMPAEGGVGPRWVDRPTIERKVDRLIVRAPVHDQDGRAIAVAAIQYSLWRENAAYAALRWRILAGAAALAGFLSVLLIVATRRWISGPLANLLESVRQVQVGQRIVAWSGASNDEVGRLAAAFGRMAEAVNSRERAIVRRNEDMRRVLDSVGDGFIALDYFGRMAPERSAIIDQWFGSPRPEQTIQEFLHPIDACFADMLGCGLQAIRDNVLPFEVNLHQMPKQFMDSGRHFRCSYRPVVRGENRGYDQLVMVIADVTSEIERVRSEAAQRDLMASVSHVIADKSGFQAFLEEANELVSRVIGSSDGDEWPAQLKRDLHTLKGITATFGLQAFSSQCHTLEDRIEDTGNAPLAGERAALRENWEDFRQKIRVFTGERAQRHIELASGEYEAFKSALGARLPYEKLSKLASKWEDEPVLSRLEHLGEHARTLSACLGRCPIDLDFGNTCLRLPREPWRHLWSALVHLVRNAVEHGGETPAERAATGKLARAQLTLTAAESAEAIVITIGDDGKGIDWERLRERAARLGLPNGTRADLIHLMFRDGVSTRDSVSETSGRGVGLAVVRQEVERLGGRISVESSPGHGTRFTIVVPVSGSGLNRRMNLPSSSSLG